MSTIFPVSSGKDLCDKKDLISAIISFDKEGNIAPLFFRIEGCECKVLSYYQIKYDKLKENQDQLIMLLKLVEKEGVNLENIVNKWNSQMDDGEGKNENEEESNHAETEMIHANEENEEEKGGLKEEEKNNIKSQE